MYTTKDRSSKTIYRSLLWVVTDYMSFSSSFRSCICFCVCVRAQVLSFSFCAVSTVNQIAQVFFLSVFLFAPHKMTFPSSSMPFTMHKVENGGSTVERFSHNIIFLGLCHSKCQLKHFPTAYKKTLKKRTQLFHFSRALYRIFFFSLFAFEEIELWICIINVVFRCWIKCIFRIFKLESCQPKKDIGMLKRKDLLELHFVCESRTANKLFHFKIAMINMFNYGVFVICWHSVYAKTPSQRGTSKWFGPFSQIIHIKLLLSIDSFEMNSFHWLTELCLFVSIFTWFNEFSNSMNAPRQTPNMYIYKHTHKSQKYSPATRHLQYFLMSLL